MACTDASSDSRLSRSARTAARSASRRRSWRCVAACIRSASAARRWSAWSLACAEVCEASVSASSAVLARESSSTEPGGG
eukprot:scaffold66673_cov33-Phaeocystis_antarctica.AAC.2